MMDYDVVLELPDDNYCEVIIIANVIHYSPEREKPMAAPGTAAWADEGDSEECDYTPKGFLRFAPDAKNKNGFMIELTLEQIENIINYFGIENQIIDKARIYYYEY